MILNSDEIIVALAIKYQGDWNSIYAALTNPQDRDLDEYLRIAKKMKSKYVTILSEEYPRYLKECFKPPFVLFYYGDISLMQNIGKNVAVVGSRSCSEYGIKATEDIVGGITDQYNIVSGLAIGIDSIAHNAAIDNGAKTIAVLPGGIDYCYPPSHKKIYNIIKKDHLLISEIPGDSAPEQISFPIRNRIIAGLSKTLLVTEAHPLSGTLTTVLLALEGNSDVMCVPYPVGDNSECNRLIMNGASLVENADDVVDQMSKY